MAKIQVTTTVAITPDDSDQFDDFVISMANHSSQHGTTRVYAAVAQSLATNIEGVVISAVSGAFGGPA